MNNTFQAYSSYYNLFYEAKDYESEVKYVHSHIQNHKPGAKSILEYGSGSGGHGLLLEKLGYTVLGLEKSTKMVELAVNNGLACKVADIADYKLYQKYDVVVALFHVISYLNTNEQILNAFNLASQHLNTDGIFIFDVWYTAAVYHQLPQRRIKKAENEKVIVTRTAVPVINYRDNIVDVNYQILVLDKLSGTRELIEECHRMRHFSLPEISLLAKFTGFNVIKVEEFLTAADPSIDTWGVSFILKKKGNE